MYINPSNFIKQSSMNEATFYGKNPLLLECEKIVTRMIPKIKAFKMNEIFDDEIPELEKQLEELFGFERVFINFTHLGTHTLPAYMTASNFYAFNPKFTAKKGKYGPIFSKKDHIKTYINLGFEMFTNNLTAEEIMGFIIHEVGHSFSFTIKSRLICLNPATMVLFFNLSIMKSISKNAPDLVKIINKIFVPFKKLYSLIFDFGYDLMSLISLIPYVGFISLGMSTLATLTPVGLVTKIYPAVIGYDDEKFSDYFATSFGYGEAMNSGLVKIEKNTLAARIVTDTKNGQSNSFINYIYAYNIFAMSLTASMYAPHPRHIDRMTLCINYLKKSEKEETNKRAKMDLHSQITELEKLRDSYLADMPDDLSELESNQAELFNGKISPDFRNMFTEVEDDIIRNLDVN